MGVYRGDSRICVAATHAGVVSSLGGGCARMRLRGPATGFAASAQNALRSLPFDSWFPQRYLSCPANSDTG
jgi:hypothetical protein